MRLCSRALEQEKKSLGMGMATHGRTVTVTCPPPMSPTFSPNLLPFHLLGICRAGSMERGGYKLGGGAGGGGRRPAAAVP